MKTPNKRCIFNAIFQRGLQLVLNVIDSLYIFYGKDYKDGNSQSVGPLTDQVDRQLQNSSETDQKTAHCLKKRQRSAKYTTRNGILKFFYHFVNETSVVIEIRPASVKCRQLFAMVVSIFLAVAISALPMCWWLFFDAVTFSMERQLALRTFDELVVWKFLRHKLRESSSRAEAVCVCGRGKLKQFFTWSAKLVAYQTLHPPFPFFLFLFLLLLFWLAWAEIVYI